MQGNLDGIQSLFSQDLASPYDVGFSNASSDLSDPECLELFVQNGADVNWRDCHKRTPMGYAAKMGKSRNLGYLLSQGADPHTPDYWGHTPFSEAVLHRHHRVLQLLLRKDNIIPKVKLISRMSILRLAATDGGIKTLRLLASRDIRNLEPDECNTEGQTAQDLSCKRLQDSRRNFICKESGFGVHTALRIVAYNFDLVAPRVHDKGSLVDSVHSSGI